MARLCSSLVLSLVIAGAANATPLALSQSDVTWTSSMIGGLRSEISVHFEDLASPTPGIGLIQLEIFGRVEAPASPWFGLEYSFLSVYGDVYDNRAHTAVRFSNLETEFTRGDGTSTTFSPGLTGYRDPITYGWIWIQTPDPFRRIEWHATAELQFAVGTDPVGLSFDHAFQGSAPKWCTRQLRCRDRLRQVDFLEITATPVSGTTSAGLRIAMVPEPSTSLLVIAGLLGLAVQRRARA